MAIPSVKFETEKHPNQTTVSSKFYRNMYRFFDAAGSVATKIASTTGMMRSTYPPLPPRVLCKR